MTIQSDLVIRRVSATSKRFSKVGQAPSALINNGV
jgi:hypothetical protein